MEEGSLGRGEGLLSLSSSVPLSPAPGFLCLVLPTHSCLLPPLPFACILVLLFLRQQSLALPITSSNLSSLLNKQRSLKSRILRSWSVSFFLVTLGNQFKVERDLGRHESHMSHESKKITNQMQVPGKQKKRRPFGHSRFYLGKPRAVLRIRNHSWLGNVLWCLQVEGGWGVWSQSKDTSCLPIFAPATSPWIFATSPKSSSVFLHVVFHSCYGKQRLPSKIPVLFWDTGL